jgi:hypothetical protein
MLHRLKKALVDSYVGAIALGYLFGEGVEQLAMVVSAPFSEWIGLKELHRIYPQGSADAGFSFRASVGPLIHGVFFLLAGLALLRWLYYPAKVKVPSEESNNAEHS